MSPTLEAAQKNRSYIEPWTMDDSRLCAQDSAAHRGLGRLVGGGLEAAEPCRWCQRCQVFFVLHRFLPLSMYMYTNTLDRIFVWDPSPTKAPTFRWLHRKS